MKTIPVLLIFWTMTLFQPLLSQEIIEKDDSKFPIIELETLHVHSELKHIEDKIAINEQELSNNNETFYPVSSFYKSEKKVVKMYLLKTDKRRIYLLTINLKTGKTIFFDVISYHEFNEGAYEVKQNALIADFNDDGFLDIGIIKRLNDFEIPTEEISNISGEKKYLLTYENNTYKYTNWEYDFYSNYRLIPKGSSD